MLGAALRVELAKHQFFEVVRAVEVRARRVSRCDINRCYTKKRNTKVSNGGVCVTYQGESPRPRSQRQAAGRGTWKETRSLQHGTVLPTSTSTKNPTDLLESMVEQLLSRFLYKRPGSAAYSAPDAPSSWNLLTGSVAPQILWKCDPLPRTSDRGRRKHGHEPNRRRSKKDATRTRIRCCPSPGNQRQTSCYMWDIV